MTKTILYTYFGTNGIITSEVHLENISALKKVRLTADEGKILTNGVVSLDTVVTTEESVDSWKEINMPE